MKEIEIQHFPLWPANLVRGILVGIVSACTITLFANTIALLTALRKAHFALLFLIPLSAVLTEFLYKKFGNDYRMGTVKAIDEINAATALDEKKKNLATSQVSAIINPMLAIISFVAACLTHISGAAGGKEGAGVQIGLSSSTFVERIENRMFHQKTEIMSERTTYYLMCGAASAFGSLFAAPIAGVFFGTQFASPRSSRLDAYLPCIASSYSAVFISQALGIHTLSIPPVTALPFTLANTLIVVFFALAIGLASRFFCFGFKQMRAFFQHLSGNGYLRVLIPSLVLLSLALLSLVLFPSQDFNGLGGDLLSNAVSLSAPFWGWLFRFLLMALTYSALFCGGEVVPLMLFGALIGNAFSTIAGLPVSAFAALGAVTMLSGGTNLPLVCFALGFELFGYRELTLLFMACALSFVSSGTSGIYAHQIDPRSN